MNHSFKILVEALPVPTFIIDINHVVIAWNKACEDLTGISAVDIVGTKDAWKGFYKYKRPCLANVVIGTAETIDELYSNHGKSKFNQGFNTEAWFPDLNGKSRYLTFNAEPIYSDTGELLGALENLEDKTSLKETEQHLVESTEQLANANQILQAILNSIPGGVFWKDIHLNYLGSNTSFARDGGMKSPEDLIGKCDFDMPWRDLAEEYRSDDQEVLDSKVSKLNIIEQFRDINGTRKWLVTNKVPIINCQNELIGVLGTYADISNLKAMEIKLISAKENAEKANQAKSDFLSSMSHELRTPMNAVLGFSQLLLSDNKEPLSADQKESVSYIIDSGNYLLELINGVLDLSKIEMNQTDVNFEVFTVQKIIADITTFMLPEAEKSSISLINQTADSTESPIEADYNKLKQVLLNLVSNAIKYNNENGSVTISCNITDSDTVRIFVTDTGKGVSEDNMPKLFEPFNRLEHANSAILGTGIGLTISKQLVELMNGEIGVYNNPDHGLTFWVEFKQVTSALS